MSIENNKKITPQQRYAKKNIKQFKLDCVVTTEADIIEHLEAQANKAGYIKNLIRQDMKTKK